mmetsp:Transcript_15787/g.42569  ORF Transcript_15787/g.42569 Transcript_15787/m.42569 type:complete len:1120 (+) Transcript_15787:457-3816(+)
MVRAASGAAEAPVGTSVTETQGATDSGAGAGWGRRDKLLEIEADIQRLWEERRTYESDAPAADGEGVADSDKFFVTFPYPYMNGRLHLGHAFSITKAEFAARFARLDGKQVLFPFAFHCTGMPISAAAMKLEKSVAERKDPGKDQLSEGRAEEDSVDEEAEASGDEEQTPGVFSGKKSKVAAKTGGMDQYDIMLAMGISEEEIPNFIDPQYWLKYFPPFAVQDMKRLGTAVDWRRAFITTDMNPYYDAFIRWQFQKLRNKYLENGKRESIYSTLTKQPCADHDRAEGEGVKPQEYTLIKLQVSKVPEAWESVLDSGTSVYLVAATLRPETMYGQTNCFVLPDGNYGLFQMNNQEVFVCTERSARNMCYQGLGDLKESPTGEQAPICLLETTGKDLVGLPLKAPLAAYETVYALPMLTISMEKGTGIVTSVPAEAPDDYACLKDWKTRENWRQQFGVKEEWCEPFDVVSIMEIPDSEFGSASAPYICEKMKIGSHKEKDKLNTAKKEVYMKGFYSGVLTVGPYAGQKVSEVKDSIKQDLISSNQATRYFEPEGKVISRSGDECVVALCDQWYLKYGDDDWTQRVRQHVENNFDMYNEAALNNLSHAVGWLGDWACSRTFGLGTKLPWDEQWLIESLSDSTIYMAYYAIAHILEGGRLTGDGAGSIKAEDLTEEVFDYVFCLRDSPPEGAAIAQDVLDKMRREFKYWYPVDLRCSGKDLIQNHLTMSLFTHAAVWEDASFWPRSFFCNGHVLIDSEKMSKSKGNFLTLEESIDTYSADATRIVCADSGDTLQDANFSREIAGKTILRLTTLLDWATESMAKMAQFRHGDYTFLDNIFHNELSKIVLNAHTAYKRMVYSDALRAAYYDIENLRSQYSILTNGDVHADVIKRILDVQTVILSPIAPHFCEHLWRNVLGNDSLVVEQAWPHPEKEPDPVLLRQYETLQATLRAFRLKLDSVKSPKKKKKKGAQADAPPPKPSRAVAFVAKGYSQWQQEVLKLLQDIELDEQNCPKQKDFMRSIKDAESIKALPKQDLKKAMPFASFMMKEVQSRGPEALELQLPFDEAQMLQDMSEVIKSQLGIEEFQIAAAEEEHPCGADQQRLAAGPGKPQIVFLEKEPATA